MKAFVISTLCAAGLALAAPARAQMELKVGDQAPNFKLAGVGRQDVSTLRLQGQTGRRAGLVPAQRSQPAAPSSASRSRSTAT